MYARQDGFLINFPNNRAVDAKDRGRRGGDKTVWSAAQKVHRVRGMIRKNWGRGEELVYHDSHLLYQGKKNMLSGSFHKQV